MTGWFTLASRILDKFVVEISSDLVYIRWRFDNWLVSWWLDSVTKATVRWPWNVQVRRQNAWSQFTQDPSSSPESVCVRVTPQTIMAGFIGLSDELYESHIFMGLFYQSTCSAQIWILWYYNSWCTRRYSALMSNPRCQSTSMMRGIGNMWRYVAAWKI